MQSVTQKLEAERAELDAVLASGTLGKTNNPVRLLTFVCEKYFEGDTGEIKEYSIAVNALGRPQDFDPQVDTIVRVTAHTLRKRLEEYYRSEGADHPIQISLPPGGYVPNFIRKGDTASNGNGKGHSAVAESAPHNGSLRLQETRIAPPPFAPLEVVEDAGVSDKEPVVEPSPIHAPQKPGTVWALALILTCLGVTCLALAGFYLWHRKGETSASPQIQLTVPVSTAGAVRVMLGDGRKPYVDESGSTWETDRFCSGGESFYSSRPEVGANIAATGDAQLFLGGRRGRFHCAFPVPTGVYEVHLLFAETGGLLENARDVGFSINGGQVNNVDVVDDASAPDTATTKVFTDVQPGRDGVIRLDFSTPNSFLNAVEILPGIPQQILPIRIVAGRHTTYRDASGNLWLPDRYYFGGRPSNIGNDVTKLPNGRLYEGQRIGHFHYAIPVVPGRKYTLKLYFLERWFGLQNQNVGGVGSRTFTISCNGTTLLKDFDIMRESNGGPAVESFPHLEPTAQGKLEIYFTPGVNYPAVSAIEVLPE